MRPSTSPHSDHLLTEEARVWTLAVSSSFGTYLRLTHTYQFVHCVSVTGHTRAIAVLFLCAACTVAPPSPSCEPSAGHSFICGAPRPEDLARIPNTRWLVFSGFSDGSGLKLVDTRMRSMRQWYTGEHAQIAFDTSRFPACPSPPDARRLNTQGLSLRTVDDSQYDLYVVNHGGRESIEIFRIDAARDEPTIRWIGCIEMPPATPANSVATYSDGTVLASVLTHPGTSITDFVRGEATGGVYE